jgi:hypothetical protein
MKSESHHHVIITLLFVTVLIGTHSVTAFSTPKVPVRLVLTPGKFDEKLNKCVGGPGLCTIDLEVITNNTSIKDMGIGTAELNDDKLILSLELPLRGNITKLPLGHDISLNKKQSAAFGYDEVIILKGDYEADRSKNKLGVFTFNVKTNGLLKQPQKSK